MYTSAGVAIKYLATPLGYLQFSCTQLFCGCGERCLWVVMDIWEFVSRPDWTISQGAKIKKGRLKSNKCIYWDSLILLQFNINMYYKGVNWGNNWISLVLINLICRNLWVHFTVSSYYLYKWYKVRQICPETVWRAARSVKAIHIKCFHINH